MSRTWNAGRELSFRGWFGGQASKDGSELPKGDSLSPDLPAGDNDKENDNDTHPRDSREGDNDKSSNPKPKGDNGNNSSTSPKGYNVNYGNDNDNDTPPSGTTTGTGTPSATPSANGASSPKWQPESPLSPADSEAVNSEGVERSESSPKSKLKRNSNNSKSEPERSVKWEPERTPKLAVNWEPEPHSPANERTASASASSSTATTTTPAATATTATTTTTPATTATATTATDRLKRKATIQGKWRTATKMVTDRLKRDEALRLSMSALVQEEGKAGEVPQLPGIIDKKIPGTDGNTNENPVHIKTSGGIDGWEEQFLHALFLAQQQRLEEEAERRAKRHDKTAKAFSDVASIGKLTSEATETDEDAGPTEEAASAAAAPAEEPVPVGPTQKSHSGSWWGTPAPMPAPVEKTAPVGKVAPGGQATSADRAAPANGTALAAAELALAQNLKSDSWWGTPAPVEKTAPGAGAAPGRQAEPTEDATVTPSTEAAPVGETAPGDGTVRAEGAAPSNGATPAEGSAEEPALAEKIESKIRGWWGMLAAVEKKGVSEGSVSIRERRSERTVHVRTSGDVWAKHFSERVAPRLHDSAAKGEGFKEWKEQFIHERFAKQEAGVGQDNDVDFTREAHARQLEENAVEHKLHMKSRSAKLIKYFGEKVSPSIHDAALKKEGFGEWKEQFLHDRFAKQEEKLRQDHDFTREAHARKIQQKTIEHKMHMKTRSDKLIKYFGEKVSPSVHDTAAEKEGFGEWKEQFLHDRFAKQEEKLRQEHEFTREAHARQLEENAVEHKSHVKTRANRMVKYFSENFASPLHCIAAKKEGFGEWKEQFMHDRFAKQEAGLGEDRDFIRETHARQIEQKSFEHKLHMKTRSDKLIKYFGEKVSPSVHDAALEKEGFGEWKEQFLHDRFAKQDQKLRQEHDFTREAHARQRREYVLEQKLHKKTQSAKMLKYFSEKVAPEVHDVASKKRGFGEWKEQFFHDRFAKQGDKLRQEHEFTREAHARQRREDILEQKLHKKAQSAKMLKYFSEKVSPAVHDKAGKKEGFGEWKEQFRHDRFVKQIREAREEMEQAGRRKEEELHKVHKEKEKDLVRRESALRVRGQDITRRIRDARMLIEKRVGEAGTTGEAANSEGICNLGPSGPSRLGGVTGLWVNQNHNHNEGSGNRSGIGAAAGKSSGAGSKGSNGKGANGRQSSTAEATAAAKGAFREPQRRSTATSSPPERRSRGSLSSNVPTSSSTTADSSESPSQENQTSSSSQSSQRWTKPGKSHKMRWQDSDDAADAEDIDIARGKSPDPLAQIKDISQELGHLERFFQKSNAPAQRRQHSTAARLSGDAS